MSVEDMLIYKLDSTNPSTSKVVYKYSLKRKYVSSIVQILMKPIQMSTCVFYFEGITRKHLADHLAITGYLDSGKGRNHTTRGFAVGQQNTYTFNW